MWFITFVVFVPIAIKFMNRRTLTISIALLLLLGVGAYFALRGGDNIPDVTLNPGDNSGATTTPNTPNNPNTPATHPNVRVTTPQPNATVGQNFTVKGEARLWYFEGSFPVEVVDANGKKLAIGIAQAQGEWMTTDFVPFNAPITLNSVPATQTGTIILRKDNPSGLPQNDDEFRVPIKFGTFGASTPIQDAVRSLLDEWDLPGVVLKGASLSGGVLTLEFSDPQNQTSGGSARVTQFRNQIEAAVRPYGVTSVRYLPVGVFEP